MWAGGRKGCGLVVRRKEDVLGGGHVTYAVLKARGLVVCPEKARLCA